MTEKTNSRNFRTKLSEYFDKALKEPVSIIRGNDRFILLDESKYVELKDEVISLQKNLIGMLQVQEGKSEKFANLEDGVASLLEEIAKERNSSEKKKKSM